MNQKVVRTSIGATRNLESELNRLIEEGMRIISFTVLKVPGPTEGIYELVAVVES